VSDPVQVGAWDDAGVDDRALVDAIRAGDREAFRMLVELETPTLYRICLRILGRSHEAEDVTQEAFVAAYRSRRSFRGDGPPRAWLARIATRLAFRRIAGRRPTVDIDAVKQQLAADAGVEPANAVIAAERREEVRRAVVALGEPYREVVALRFFGELSLAEVADATDRPVNTVKTHLRRGLERLRPLLGQPEVDR
jgi:RNA polymerase sigma-70 factor, ECF subfamily